MRKHLPLPQILTATVLLFGSPARADIPPGPPPGPPPAPTPEAKVEGSLDKEVIRRVIRRHILEVKRCYEDALTKKPDLGGRVLVRFVVSKTGDVTEAKTQESTMKYPPAEECINTAVKTWKFPKPSGGGNVTVVYPFLLKADGPPPGPPPNLQDPKAR